MFSSKKKLIKVDLFVVAAFALSLIVFFFTAFHLWNSYQTSKKIRAEQVYIQANKISTEVDNKLLYIANVINFLGEKVATSGGENFNYISSLFSEQFIANQRVANFFSWTGFDWTTPEGMLVVSTMHGVLSKPIDMNFRYYVQQAPIEPGVLHFDSPSIGKTSNQWVIPAGIGITDKNNRYLGLISVGVNINELGKSLEKVLLNNGLKFTLLDNNKNIIYASGVAFEDFDLLASAIKLNVSKFVKEEGFLAANFSFGNTEFSYYKKLEKYPYTILVGYDSIIAKNQFYNAIKVGGPLIMLLGIFSLVLIFTLRHIIVQPVTKLSKIADDIVNNGILRKLPRSSTYEIHNLSRKLLNLHRLIRKQEITKNQLVKAHEIIRESEQEREAFLKDMHRTLHVPISAIMNGATLLKQQRLGEFNIENYGIIIDAMFDASRQLESLTTEFLNPSEVDVAEVLNKCVTLQRRYATEKGVEIKLIATKKIPSIWADRLRIRQIILSTIYHSLLYIPNNEGKKITITAKYEDNSSNKEQWLEIVIKDSGFGVDENTRNIFWSKHFNGSESFNRDPNMMNLNIKTLRHLIALHRGTFEIKVLGKNGTLFVIRIPYLTREDLEAPLELDSQYSKKVDEFNEKIKVALDKDKNVLQFPAMKKNINQDEQ